MPVTAKLRHLRITPRKVRLVADLMRGKKVEEAQNILNFTIKKAASPLLKLLRSAVANAKNSFRLDESNLYISKILVDEGPKYKRWRARARGSADLIQKKTSHVTIILDEIVKKPPKESKLPTGQAKKVKKLRTLPPPEGPKRKFGRVESAVPPGLESRPKGGPPVKPKVIKEEEREEKVEKVVKPKVRPEIEVPKPKIERGIRRIFRRKAF